MSLGMPNYWRLSPQLRTVPFRRDYSERVSVDEFFETPPSFPTGYPQYESPPPYANSMFKRPMPHPTSPVMSPESFIQRHLREVESANEACDRVCTPRAECQSECFLQQSSKRLHRAQSDKSYFNTRVLKETREVYPDETGVKRKAHRAVKPCKVWWQEDFQPHSPINKEYDKPHHDKLISDFERVCGPIESVEFKQLLIRTFTVWELPTLHFPSPKTDPLHSQANQATLPMTGELKQLPSLCRATSSPGCLEHQPFASAALADEIVQRTWTLSNHRRRRRRQERGNRLYREVLPLAEQVVKFPMEGSERALPDAEQHQLRRSKRFASDKPGGPRLQFLHPESSTTDADADTDTALVSPQTEPQLRRTKKFMLSKASSSQTNVPGGKAHPGGGLPSVDPARGKEGDRDEGMKSAENGLSAVWSDYRDKLRRGEFEGFSWEELVETMRVHARHGETDDGGDTDACCDGGEREQ